MFGFFRKKEARPAIRDLVWANESHKWMAAHKMRGDEPGTIVVAWFDETIEQFKKANNHANAIVYSARQIMSPQVADKKVIFLEHYPVYKREAELIMNWKAKEIIVMSSLDEPLFRRFGGDKITTMLERLGQKPDEAIEHSLVTRAIANAQKKIEDKVLVEHLAGSQEDWFRKNFPSS